MIEVFIAIMLMAGGVVFVLNKNSFAGGEVIEASEKLTHIIKTIQRDYSLRGEILNAVLPVEWDDFGSSGLTNTRAKIIEKTPENLICEAKVCALDDDCVNAGAPEDRNTYSESGYFSADLDTYSPRQLKLFCWRK